MSKDIVYKATIFDRQTHRDTKATTIGMTSKHIQRAIQESYQIFHTQKNIRNETELSKTRLALKAKENRFHHKNGP